MDRYTVLVAWMPPHNQNGRIIHYTIYMKTMEVSRGQYTRQFRVKPSTASSSGLYGHNQNQKTNVFYAVQGLNEVNFLDVYHKLAGECCDKINEFYYVPSRSNHIHFG